MVRWQVNGDLPMQKVQLPSSPHHGKLSHATAPQQPLHQLQSKVKPPIAVAIQLTVHFSLTLCFAAAASSRLTRAMEPQNTQKQQAYMVIVFLALPPDQIPLITRHLCWVLAMKAFMSICHHQTLSLPFTFPTTSPQIRVSNLQFVASSEYQYCFFGI